MAKPEIRLKGFEGEWKEQPNFNTRTSCEQVPRQVFDV